MSEADELHAILAEWVASAEADYRCATRLLEDGEAWSAPVICFHSQQCVEKYLKALLVQDRIDFPKCHDLRRLMEMLRGSKRPRLSRADQNTLTPYATVTRYPGALRSPGKTEAVEAAAIATRVRDSVRRMLPPDTLCR